jgi:hypothetical protein
MFLGRLTGQKGSLSTLSNRIESASRMPSKSFVRIDFRGDALASFNKASTVTKDDARPVLDFLSAGFDITWFQERSPRLWLAVLKPKEKSPRPFPLIDGIPPDRSWLSAGLSAAHVAGRTTRRHFISRLQSHSLRIFFGRK